MNTQAYQDLKNFVKENYDYISVIDIAKINKDWGRPLTLKQCNNIHWELFPESHQNDNPGVNWSDIRNS